MMDEDDEDDDEDDDDDEDEEEEDDDDDDEDDDDDDDDDDCFQYLHHQLKHDYPLCFGSTEVSPVTLQVNAPDVHGQRPLHQAVLNKHQEAHACFFCIDSN